MSVPNAKYFPGKRRNKNAIHARSEMAWSILEPHWATDSMQWMMEIEKRRIWLIGVYYFWYVENCHPM